MVPVIKVCCDICGKEAKPYITELVINGNAVRGEWCLNCIDEVVKRETK